MDQILFDRHSDAFRVAMMASLGFSTDYISRATGLTPSQISYRTKMASVKRSDYRNGESKVAQATFQALVLQDGVLTVNTKNSLGGTWKRSHEDTLLHNREERAKAKKSAARRKAAAAKKVPTKTRAQ